MRFYPVITAFAIAAGGNGIANANPSVEIFQSNGCVINNQSDCTGSQQGFRVQGHDWQFTLRTGHELDGHMPLNQRYSLGFIGDMAATIKWKNKMSHTTAEGLCIVRPSDNFAVNLGIYVGTVNAHINFSATAGLYDFGLPFIPLSQAYRIGRDGYDISLASYRYNRIGSSPYGGLSAQFVGIHAFTSTINGFGTASAQAGLDKKSIGAGLGIAYHTRGIPPDSARSWASFCNNGTMPVSQGFSVAGGVCADKILQDPFYNRMVQKFGPLANRLNGWTARAQNVVNAVENRTGYGYDLRTHSAESVARWMGLESPYKMRNSFIVAASYGIGNAAVSVTSSVPIGDSALERRISASLRYSF